MRKITIIIMLMGLFRQSIAQPTQAEIDKMMQKAKMEIDKMKQDPKNKDLISKMPNIDSLMSLGKNNESGITAAMKAIKADSIATAAKNRKLISQLPKKP